MSEIEKLDHVALGTSRIIQQYKDKAKFVALIELLTGKVQDMEDAFHAMLLLTDIDAMGGTNLDTIGVIVGQPRELVDAADLPFFGFLDDASAFSFGDLNDSSIGARFISLGEDETESVLLSDQEYRLFLRARIAKNNTSARPEDMIEQLKLLFSIDDVEYNEGLMTISLGVGKILDAFEIYIIENYDLFPKPAGVRIAYVYNYTSGDVFAFAGTSGQGFGDVNDGSVGGHFAGLLGTGTPIVRQHSTAFSSAFA